jgi:hypothetical protein
VGGRGLSACFLSKSKCERVRYRDETVSSSVAKVGGDVFAHFHIVVTSQ